MTLPLIDVTKEAGRLKAYHWSNENSTVSQLKGKCLEGCKEILNEHDVTWDEIRYDRDYKTSKAKQHVCAFIHLALLSVMSEVEMSELTGIKRTSFRYCRIAFFEKNKDQGNEQSAT